MKDVLRKMRNAASPDKKRSQENETSVSLNAEINFNKRFKTSNTVESSALKKKIAKGETFSLEN